VSFVVDAFQGHGWDAVPFQNPDAETFPQPTLRHFDRLAGLNFSVAGRWRFFSQQLRGNPQRFYFLSHSYDFLLFHAQYFKWILHGEGSLSTIDIINHRSGIDSKPVT